MPQERDSREPGRPESTARELLSELDAVVWRYETRTQRYLFVSSTIGPLLGYEKVEGSAAVDLLLHQLDPSDIARLREVRRAVGQDGRARSCDLVMIAADGRPRTFETRVSRAASGDINGVMIDVTQRRREEDVLRNARDQLDTTLNALAEGITVQELGGRVIWANDRAAQVCGLQTGPDLVAAPIMEIFNRFTMMDEHGDPLPLERLPGRRALAGEEAPELLMQTYDRLTGERTFQIIKSRPIKDARGAITSAVNIWHDVTARKVAAETHRFLAQAGDLLSGSLDYLRTLETLAPLTVPFIADACAIWLREGDTIRRVASAGAAAPAELAAGATRAMTTGRAVEDTDGLHTPLVARGSTIGVMTFVHVEPRRAGAAERTLAEELARRTALYVHNARLYEESRQAVRARDDLLAVVSHDLKNPLVAILVQASLVARCEEAKSERVKRYIDSIQRSAERMRRFIHDTLDMVAIEAGRLELDRRPCEPTALIADALDLIQPLAVEKSIRLHAAVPKPCPAVVCDRERVAQVFSNLVGNAVKFTPERGEILVSAFADDDEPSHVRFCVEDTGPGIPAPDLPRLFEKYWRAPRGEHDREGSGLGLSIVKGIVEAHGGRVWAESTPGVGSRFYFTLPAA